MSSNETHSDDTSTDDSAQTTDFSDSQVSPLRLTDFNGCDHRGSVKLTIDEETIPSDASDDVTSDMNWAIEALNTVVHYPNLLLWVRGASNDLLLGHEPGDGHERAGYIRAATFSRPHGDADTELTTETEIDAGLLTPFAAVNVLYDYIVGRSYGRGTSLLLTEVTYLQNREYGVDHPILPGDTDAVSWGQGQLRRRSFPFPRDRDRTALPECDYLDQQHRNPHDHAEEAINAHLDAFTRD